MTEAALPAGSAPGRAAPVAAPPFSPLYTRYALIVLMAIYTLNFLDRQVINILAEPIKQELGLSDTQLGLMSGFAFAVFYTFLGIPIARLAERKNRPWIIAGAVAAWSGFTMLCGLAQSFWQLVLFRIGVGVGEAGCTPPSHSLISDYVPKEKRASALAFYSIGTPLGSLLGLAMGGLVADAYGWRVAFFAAGAPGLLFALIAIFTLHEPRRRLSAELKARAAAVGPTLKETFQALAKKRTFWLVAFAASIKAFVGYGYSPFIASFFLRNHLEQVTELAAGFGLKPIGFTGLTMGLLGGTAGIVGTLVGGWVAERYAKKDLRAYVVMPAVASIISPFIFLGAMSVPDARGAFLLLILPVALGSLWYGPVYATAQSIVEPRMRATCAALLLFIINIVGLGLGPVAVGALSDTLAGPVGLGEAQGVRWALTCSAFVGLIAAGLFWAARRTIREEMES